MTAVPLCDGHDSAIMTVNQELVRHGIEVIYLGYHRSVRDVVRAAIQEDVQAIGISSYNGGHVEFFSEVLNGLRRRGASHIGVFGGGGATITERDARIMKRRGVDEIFPAGTKLTNMAGWVKGTYGHPEHLRNNLTPTPSERGGSMQFSNLPRSLRRYEQTDSSGQISDLALARCLSELSSGVLSERRKSLPCKVRRSELRHSDEKPLPLVIGITGPGGAGKTTLIDELVLRFLATRPIGRVAILSHDPGIAGRGALLGDRASMIYAQHNRVFMRSVATGGHAHGVASVTETYVKALKNAGFDLVLVESAGIGQEDMPFRRGIVDKQILVLSPEYGGVLQLHKILMLEVADVVVLNKSDRVGARTASAEIQRRLESNLRGQKLVSTVAKQHRDAGVDRLFEEVLA